MTDEPEQTASKKRRTGRSPAYPFISVKKALEQAQALLTAEGEYAAPLPSAIKAWGYGAKSSGGRQTLATMKYYGLIDISGEGDARKVKVSDAALQILRDPREDETEKNQRIRRVALTPVAHKAIYEEYDKGLASDGSVLHFLMTDHGFKPDAAKELLDEFKETSEFIGLYHPSNKLDKKDEKDDSLQELELPQITKGDKVQWVSNGVDQFPAPATVLDLSEDGLWVFTDQGQAAVPTSEVIVVNSQDVKPTGANPPPTPAHVLAALKAKDAALEEGWHEERLLDDSGDEIFIRYEGEPSAARYEFIRDYLDFKIARLKKIQQKGGAAN